MILLDTNILIEILKNNHKTISLIETYKRETLYVSAISAMELYYGALNKKELEKLKHFIDLFNIIYLSEEISKKSLEIILLYSKSHSLDIPDSLIASSAIINNLKIFTYNVKDFKFIDELELLN